MCAAACALAVGAGCGSSSSTSPTASSGSPGAASAPHAQPFFTGAYVLQLTPAAAGTSCIAAPVAIPSTASESSYSDSGIVLLAPVTMRLDYAMRSRTSAELTNGFLWGNGREVPIGSYDVDAPLPVRFSGDRGELRDGVLRFNGCSMGFSLTAD